MKIPGMLFLSTQRICFGYAAVIALWCVASCGQKVAPRVQQRQEFTVRSRSMEPSFLPGEVVEVEAITGIGDVKIGDVVVIQSPLGGEGVYLRRVAGIENQVISGEGNVIIIDNEKISLEQLGFPCGSSFPKAVNAVTIPKDCVFTLGDNLANSRDGREFGPTPFREIIGKVLTKK